jgi:hypothetical protein
MLLDAEVIINKQQSSSWGELILLVFFPCSKNTSGTKDTARLIGSFRTFESKEFLFYGLVGLQVWHFAYSCKVLATDLHLH